jgi:hypothetical protein
MPTLNVTLMISYGSLVPNGAVPRREPFNYVLEYAEESCKVVSIPPSSVDHEILLDSLESPKFLFARAEVADIIVKLADGSTSSPTTTTLAADLGWLMLVHPLGQPINSLLASTPASPAGARLRIIAFE